MEDEKNLLLVPNYIMEGYRTYFDLDGKQKMLSHEDAIIFFLKSEAFWLGVNTPELHSWGMQRSDGKSFFALVVKNGTIPTYAAKKEAA